jgi:fatty-acyl-CoA synthase
VLVDYDVASTDRALMVSPLFHVAALGMGALPAILKGATLVLERRFDAERALALIEQQQITWMSGVPTTFQMLSESQAWATTNLESLRILTCGGSPVPARVISAFERRGLAFTGGYGMTEASPGVTSLGADSDPSKSGSSGLPHFFVDVRIADHDGEQVGEIEARGANVMKRYWNRPGESDAAFRDGDWFRTGDLGYFDDDGYLYISDRLKDMIISGGENIYPAEVEAVIAELEAVADVADLDDLEREIREHLDGRLARYKIPTRIVVVDALPRTASGKVIKARLRERYLSASAGDQ